MRILFLISWLCLNLCFQAWAQFEVTGIVVDSTSSEPLAFVNLTFNNDPTLGTTTDIDGQFSFEHDSPINSIQFSYVGYNSEQRLLGNNNKDLIINLKKTNLALEEVVVIAGENPAYAIIRKAARNRRRHDPEWIKEYTCDSYNKLRVFDEYNSPEPAEHIDSSKRIDIYYTLVEVVSKIKYMAFDKEEERIVATQVSGVKEPNFISTLIEFQPNNFHKENILVLDKEYLNPITRGATQKYEYRLEDTLYQNKDTVYVIQFFPRKNVNFDALKGTLYINTKGYAIQHVLAEPAGKQKIHLRIQQQYTLINNEQWFPTQLNFEIELSPFKKDTFIVQGKRYLTNVNLHPGLTSQDFGLNKVTLEPGATSKDSIFWLQNRSQLLSMKEQKTYEAFNNMKGGLPISFLISIFNEFGDQRLQFGPVSVNYAQISESNEHEQFRLGMNLYTSYKMCPYASFGGYAAYGFGDQTWKYGGSLTLRPDPERDIGFQISYVNDVLEPAAIIQNTHTLSHQVVPRQSFIRRNMLDQMDRAREVEISTYFRSFRHLKTRLFANWSHRTPLYDYWYNFEGDKHNSFIFSRIGIQFRFSFKEDYVKFGDTNMRLRSLYPVLYFSYTKGLKGFMDGGFDFNKLLFGMQSSFFVKGLGRTNCFLQTGIVTGDKPYSILFNGRGSFETGRVFYVRNTFQTMRPNEFLVDKFIYMFVQHNFGALLLNYKSFRPEVRIFQAVGFGWLDNHADHEGVPIEDMRHGYFESGIMLGNLVRINLFNLAQFGIGAGVFVRYGPYYLPNNVMDNISFKVDMGLFF